MFAEFRRGLIHGLGFWLVPLLFALVLAGGGIAVGFASAASSQPPAAQGTPGPNAPALPEAPNKNGSVGQIIRAGAQSAEGRILIVRDRAGRMVRLLVTPQTIVKKDGKRVAPTA